MAIFYSNIIWPASKNLVSTLKGIKLQTKKSILGQQQAVSGSWILKTGSDAKLSGYAIHWLNILQICYERPLTVFFWKPYNLQLIYFINILIKFKIF